MNKNVKRKGFTLVELLIVIVVIGILAAMMMMSSTEAVTSAKASNIASGLRQWATAAFNYHEDNLDEVQTWTSEQNEVITKAVKKYMENGGKDDTDPEMDSYYVSVRDDGTWWVTYNIAGDKSTNSTKEAGLIKNKLAGRAKSLSLKQATDKDSVTKGTAGTDGNTPIAKHYGVDDKTGKVSDSAKTNYVAMQAL